MMMGTALNALLGFTPWFALSVYTAIMTVVYFGAEIMWSRSHYGIVALPAK